MTSRPIGLTLALGVFALAAACGGEAYDDVREPDPALSAEEVAEDTQWAGPANEDAPPASVIYGDEERAAEAEPAPGTVVDPNPAE